MYCARVEGSETKRSQVYPDALAEEMICQIKAWICQQQPSRFGVFQTYVAARPTTDMTAWEPVFQEIERSFAGSSKRPYIVDCDSAFGRQLQDLFRMDATKIQVAYTPSQRRFNFEEPFSARGAALEYADGARAIEVEQMEDVRFPKQRFHKPVRFAVFIFGASREEHLPPGQQQGDDPGVGVPVPGLPTDVTFPGLSAVPPEIRRTVARLHLNLGHPTANELTRLACSQGTPSSTFIEAIRKLRCGTCERLRPPQQPRPVAQRNLEATQYIW